MPVATRQRNAAKQTTQVASVNTRIKTATETSQEITVKQSQELVQMLLHSSISSVAYARDLYHDDCFTERSYDKMATYESYENYVNDDKSANSSRSNFHVLTKGGRTEVDRLIDTIENCVFDALSKKSLKALQLNIGPHEHPSHVFESYTFTFSYQLRADGQKVLGNIELKHSSGATVAHSPSPQEVRATVAAFDRNLYKFIATLPKLPEQRSLGVVMYYEGAEQLTYKGFSKTKHKFAFGQGEKWRKDVHNISGVLDTGHHGVSLRISHMGHFATSSSDESSEPGMIIPADLKFTNYDAGEAELDGAIEERLEEQRAAWVSHSSDTILPDSQPRGPQGCRPRKSTGAVALEENSTQLSTQTKEDFATRQKLNGMLMPSPLIANAGETQILVSPRPRAHMLLVPSHGRKLRLADDTLQDLEEWTLSRAAITSPRGSASDNRVECQCGCNEEEDDMVECQFCHRWQHLACYGYHGSNDPRLPDIHACYKCLLEEEEGLVLKQLQNLAIQRKGVLAIMEHNCVHANTLQKQLNCTLPAANQILKHLERQGLLIKEKVAARRGSYQIVPKFAETEEQRQRVEKEYFDPTVLIAHHFSVPTFTQPPATGLSTQFAIPPQQTPFTQTQRKKSKKTGLESNGINNNLNQEIEDFEEVQSSTNPTPTKSPRQTMTAHATPGQAVKSADKRKRKLSDSYNPKTPGKKIRGIFARFNATRTPIAVQHI